MRTCVTGTFAHILNLDLVYVCMGMEVNRHVFLKTPCQHYGGG